MKLSLMYYYGNTAEQYSFYRIPKVLFTDSHFHGLSMESKLLYGLLLDRMGLSIRNGWLDDDGKVYIYFTLEDTLATLGYGKDKAVRLFKELDDIGLIERRKQGQGRPMRIYVKNFILPTEQEPDAAAPTEDESPAQTSENTKSGLLDISEVLTSEKTKSTLPKKRSLDFGKTDTNKTDKNKTDLNDTETPSSPLPPTAVPPRRARREQGNQTAAYRTIIQENVSYDILLRDYGCDPELVNSYVELMAEVCGSSRDTIRINKEPLPIELVRNRFLSLDMTHIVYALDVLSHNTTPVGNIRGYILSVLYNAPTVMEQYYAAQISRDMAQRGGGPDSCLPLWKLPGTITQHIFNNMKK